MAGSINVDHAMVSGVASLSASSDISQRSVVTYLKNGGISSDSFITNCLLLLIVKNCEKWLIFGEIIRCTKMVPFLADPEVCLINFLKTRPSLQRT